MSIFIFSQQDDETLMQLHCRHFLNESAILCSNSKLHVSTNNHFLFWSDGSNTEHFLHFEGAESRQRCLGKVLWFAALTTFLGSLWPGRYLTFSCCVFMISVSFFPSIISSYTHMLTIGSKRLDALTLCPIILAIVEPLEGEESCRLFIHENNGSPLQTQTGACPDGGWPIRLPWECFTNNLECSSVCSQFWEVWFDF